MLESSVGDYAAFGTLRTSYREHSGMEEAIFGTAEAIVGTAEAIVGTAEV